MNPTPLNLILWIAFAFLCGSLPLSVWVGRLITKKDVRQVGDHNPGAINALKAGGWPVGITALMLDISKGAFPVGMAYYVWGWRGWEIVPVALAPLFGSAFSPFLKFKGGKSLAVTLGITIGLTIWRLPLVILSTLTVAFLIQTISGWAVVAAMLAVSAYLFFSGATPYFWILFGIIFVLLIWKHRDDLRQPPRLRSWLRPRNKPE